MGSIDPYQVFRIFHEIRFFESETGRRADIAYMVDQSHDLKGKMEAMIQTVTMAQQLFAKAALVDAKKLSTARRTATSGRRVSVAGCFRNRCARRDSGLERFSKGLPKDPMEAFRQSGYLERITKERGREELTQRLFLCITRLCLTRLCLTRLTPSQYLAFDFGAESGRAVLAHLQSGILTTEEVHRFRNEPVEYGGSLHWDVPRLWLEVRKALASVEHMELAAIGVDAWGVDYALLGERGELLHNPYHYRDRRTHGVMEEVFQKVSKEEIYCATGIQFMPINTLYQLFAAQRQTPNMLKAAKYLVTIPDLFHYWLTGNAVCEFTNATTTQMVDPGKRTWAAGLMQSLDLPAHLPAPIVEPGSIVGTLLPEIAGHSSLFGTTGIASACHDTGSAVAAISARDGTAFLSSGTWSLLGTELDSPVITLDALRMNFTNEGGVNGTARLLKNVMGRGCFTAAGSPGVRKAAATIIGN